MIFPIRTVRTGLLAAAICLSTALFSVNAEENKPSASHLAAAEEILKVTKANRLLDQVLDYIVPRQMQLIQKLRPEIPKKTLERLQVVFVEKFRAAAPTYNKALALVYARHLTERDLRNLIAFYKTPLGLKLVDTLPVIIAESQKVGSALGAQIGQQAFNDAVKQLKKEGHEL